MRKFASSHISIFIFFIDEFVSFLSDVNGGSLQTLNANESSFRQREKQTEKAEELRRNGNLTGARKALAAGAEINHDHVRGFIEVNSAVFRFCFKRRCFKICMMLSLSSITRRNFLIVFLFSSQICRQKSVNYVVAPYEADAQIAYLMKQGYADIAVTEDSDLLAYGCQTVKGM